MDINRMHTSIVEERNEWLQIGPVERLKNLWLGLTLTPNTVEAKRLILVDFKMVISIVLII